MIFELIVVPDSRRVTRPTSNKKKQKTEVLVHTDIMLASQKISAQARGVMETKCAFLLVDLHEGSKTEFQLPLDGRDRRAIVRFHHTIIRNQFTTWDITRAIGKFNSILQEIVVAVREPLFRKRPLRIDLVLSHRKALTWRNDNLHREFDGMLQEEFMFLECNARRIPVWLRKELALHRDFVQVRSNCSMIPRRLEWFFQYEGTCHRKLTVTNTLSTEQYTVDLQHGHNGVDCNVIPLGAVIARFREPTWSETILFNQQQTLY
jgi:hypothetical protein